MTLEFLSELSQNFSQLIDDAEDHNTIIEVGKFPNTKKFRVHSSVLLELLKREDLQIDEIELWDYLIKWGMAQTSELKGKATTNLSSWSEKDFSVLRIL